MTPWITFKCEYVRLAYKNECVWISYKDVYKRNASTYPFERNAFNDVPKINENKDMSVRNAPKSLD